MNLGRAATFSHGAKLMLLIFGWLRGFREAHGELAGIPAGVSEVTVHCQLTTPHDS